MTAAAEPKSSMAATVRRIWDENPGDMPAAYRALYAEMIADQAALNEVLPSILMAWCREQIGAHVGALRIASIPMPDMTGRGSRIRSVINETLYDFPLPGGKRFGDANQAEIYAGAEAYARTEADAGHKKRYLLAAGKLVGRNNSGSAVPLAKLKTLFEETKNV